MASMINDRIDNPQEAGVDRYVGLEHLDPESLTIRRWGAPSDVTATKLLFRRGDIIFGRRRVYQGKLAVADFDGICSAHAMVLRAKRDVVLPEFLPFFMQSDTFMERAKAISVGSLSPTINWKSLAKEEFALPPLDEQRHISAQLLAIVRSEDSFERLSNALAVARESFALSLWSDLGRTLPLLDVCIKIQDGTHFSPKSSTGPYRYVTSKNIQLDELDLSDTGWISKEEHDEIYRRCDVAQGDVLLTKDGANAGNVAVNTEREPFSLLSSVAFIRPDPGSLVTAYLFEYLRSRAGRSRLLSLVKGSAITRLTLDQLRAFEVPVPSLDVQRSCCSRFIEIKEAMDSVRQRSSQLAVARALVQEILGQR